MSEAMTGRAYYIEQGYDELPDVVRKEMSRVFDTGINQSGVWVRYKEVENLAGIMAHEYTNKTADILHKIEELEQFNNTDCPEWVYKVIEGEK